MNPKTYYESLSEAKKISFAANCASSDQYFRMKIFPKKVEPKRVPSPSFIGRMVLASNGKITTAEAVEHFFTSAVEKVIAQQQKQNIAA